MTVITRFAPSPTGLLHIGNVRTALICYLIAQKEGGQFMLRIDDTDMERSKEEYVDNIKQSLEWLGLKWDFMARQSERFDRYEEIKKQFIAAGRLYPCYESAEELDMKRKMLINRGLPPIYDRSAMKLTDAEKAKFEQEGKKPHWRFKLDENTPIEWNDLVRGHIHFDAKNLSDPILIREDGSYTYMLPSTIDDVDFKITHITRGEDHISNTAIQIQLFQAMGNKLPYFAHLSLMKGKEGKISKREGGFDIQSLRDEGFEPIAISSFLARLGTADPIEARTNLKDIVANFDLSRFSKGTTIYDFAELERMNPKVLHAMSYGEVKSRPELSGIDEEFWNSVRPNIKKLAEIKEWWDICKENLTPIIDDSEFLKEASTVLPEGTWDENTWNQWVELVKQKTGRKGKDLFMPIRKAITAREHGPELKQILPLIGREKTFARLNGK